jgi:hypothetical protein
MSTDKIQYFMKLSPKRPTFISDMTDEESAIMNLHTEYWAFHRSHQEFFLQYQVRVLFLHPVFLS